MLEVFDEEHLSEMIRESVTQLCKNAFHYNMELDVDGLLGITLDKSSVMLISIKENFKVTTLQKNMPLSSSQDTPPDARNSVVGEKSRRNRKAAKTFRSDSTYIDYKEEDCQGLEPKQQAAIQRHRTVEEIFDNGKDSDPDEDVVHIDDCDEIDEAAQYVEEEEKTCLVYDSAPILVTESPDENDEENIKSPQTKRRKSTKVNCNAQGDDDLSSVADMYQMYTMLSKAINDDYNEGSSNLTEMAEEKEIEHEVDAKTSMEEDVEEGLEEDLQSQNENQASDVDIANEIPLDLSNKPVNGKPKANNLIENFVGNAVKEDRTVLALDENEKIERTYPHGDNGKVMMPLKVPETVQGSFPEQDHNNNATTSEDTSSKASSHEAEDVVGSLNTCCTRNENDVGKPITHDTIQQLAMETVSQFSEQAMFNGLDPKGMIYSSSVSQPGSFQMGASNETSTFCHMDENGDVISGVRKNASYANGFLDKTPTLTGMKNQERLSFKLDSIGHLLAPESDNTIAMNTVMDKMNIKRVLEHSLTHDMSKTQARFCPIQEQSVDGPGMIDAGQTTVHNIHSAGLGDSSVKTNHHTNSFNDYKRTMEDNIQRAIEASLSDIDRSQTGMYMMQGQMDTMQSMTNTGQSPDQKKDQDYMIKKEQLGENSGAANGIVNSHGNDEGNCLVNNPGIHEGQFPLAWHRPVCYELLGPHGERKPKKGTFNYVVQETIRAACMEFLGQSAADKSLEFDRQHRNNIVEAICERLMTRFPELRTESRVSRILNCKIRKCISNKLYYYRRNPHEKLDSLENG